MRTNVRFDSAGIQLAGHLYIPGDYPPGDYPPGDYPRGRRSWSVIRAAA
jgi:hypothetical protein